MYHFRTNRFPSDTLAKRVTTGKVAIVDKCSCFIAAHVCYICWLRLSTYKLSA